MLDCVDHSLLVSLQVEKAPTVVKAGLKKEEAEELKKKLEAGARSANAELISLLNYRLSGTLASQLAAVAPVAPDWTSMGARHQI